MKVTNQDNQPASERFARIRDYKRIAILTDSYSEPFVAKTAMSLLRYRENDVVAVIDSKNAGKTAGELFGVGGKIPIVSTPAELLKAGHLEAVFVGIAPPGGKLPEHWRPMIADALKNKLDIVSGLHDFLTSDESFVSLAKQFDCHLIDVRKNSEKTIAKKVNFRDGCLRIHTVGQDCSVGKMVAALEVERELRRQGVDARFLSTGQTGIMITGDGVPVDCVVSDFVNGVTESLVKKHDEHEFLLIEGQGSLSHPSYSSVTQGLLHGCAPDGLIYCYEVGRTEVKGLENVPLIPHKKLMDCYLANASLRHPSKFIGIAMNGRNVSDHEAELERLKMEDEFGLPVCDVYRDGAKVLSAAALKLRKKMPWLRHVSTSLNYL